MLASGVCGTDILGHFFGLMGSAAWRGLATFIVNGSRDLSTTTGYGDV